MPAALQAAPEKCPSAHKAVKFYAGRIAYWRDRMGAGSAADNPRFESRGRLRACPRYLAHVLQRKAYGLRRYVTAWLEYHYGWRSWLPDKFARVGACETGYGQRPGRWDWDSGTYVSAFGIYRPAYAQFARALGLPTWDDPGVRTPRQQYLVAAAIQARFGWGAWGCGGA